MSLITARLDRFAAPERRTMVVACGAHVLHDGYTDLLYVLEHKRDKGSIDGTLILGGLSPGLSPQRQSIGSTKAAGSSPAPFFTCIRGPFAVLFVVDGSFGPRAGDLVLVDDRGAAAIQFSSSTGTETTTRPR